MSSTHLLKNSERSGHVNLFNFGFKVASNKTIFSTFYYTLAVYPKIRFSHFGCLGRNTLYYTLAIQELKKSIKLKQTFISPSQQQVKNFPSKLLFGPSQVVKEQMSHQRIASRPGIKLPVES